MRLIVMFDLPTETSADRRNYRKFRKFLIQNGYSMMQYSIYSKIILNRSVLSFQTVKLKQNAPPKGFVETLIVTENQYANIETIVGQEHRSSQEHSTKRMIIL
ncbi:CRISPR-associated endonuclease Cas2 [Pseudogracilibacillus auburnensis]|nr:CRISPR-associated endonuclease Cas2 [Pseudogracilibacillus auburnensis]